MAQRICGTGFELFRQAGEHIQSGAAEAALVVGTESMTRNPIAAFDHRTGFKLGAPVGFKDYMWEALKDPAAGINMIQTAENLAKNTRSRAKKWMPLHRSRLPKQWRLKRQVSWQAKSFPLSPRSLNSTVTSLVVSSYKARSLKSHKTLILAFHLQTCWRNCAPSTKVAFKLVVTVLPWSMPLPRVWLRLALMPKPTAKAFGPRGCCRCGRRASRNYGHWPCTCHSIAAGTHWLEIVRH